MLRLYEARVVVRRASRLLGLEPLVQPLGEAPPLLLHEGPVAPLHPNLVELLLGLRSGSESPSGRLPAFTEARSTSPLPRPAGSSAAWWGA